MRSAQFPPLKKLMRDARYNVIYLLHAVAANQYQIKIILMGQLISTCYAVARSGRYLVPWLGQTGVVIKTVINCYS
jgi:hypothetical protein